MSDESQQYNIVNHDTGEQIKCKNCENPPITNYSSGFIFK